MTTAIEDADQGGIKRQSSMYGAGWEQVPIFIWSRYNLWWRWCKGGDYKICIFFFWYKTDIVDF